MEKYRILVVEDEEHLRNIISMNLDMEGYEVIRVSDGAKALEKFRSARFDLAILDVMIPEVDGFTVCKTIRLEGNDTPVLFLTAKNTGADRVQGLKIGGDDYLAKPFNLEELLLRVEKLIIRNSKTQQLGASLDEYSFGDNYVNFKSYIVRDKSGLEREITKREVMLLKLLIQQKDQVVSREKILETVWGYNVFPSTRTIDNYILAFRKYFEVDPRNPKYFHSVRGVGYKFSSDS